MDPVDLQSRLVASLKRLTEAGKAQWARRPIDPEWAICLAGSDLFRFELSQGREPFDPSDPVHGIHGTIRNIDFLWLEGIGGWDDLLALIEAAPVNDESYRAIEKQARIAVLHALEQLVPVTAGE